MRTALLAIPLLFACQDPTSARQQQAADDAPWPRVSPDAVGIPARVIETFASDVRSGRHRGINSLVIVRDAQLVAEHYFNGSSADDVHTMQSVSKSITSLVAGIAVDEGRIQRSTRVFNRLPEYRDLATDERKSRITIGDLLAMRAGIDFHENPYPGSPLERLNNSRGDWVRIALEPAMNAAPDERWQYNSGGVIVIAAAVQRAVDTSFVDYASTRLFRKIGITREAWARSPHDGLPHTGGGLYLTALDLVRVGQLVLDRGTWNGERVISEAWLDESMKPRTLRPRQLAGRATDYGLLWWLFPIDEARPTSDRDNVVYAASGNLNQWLFVVPRARLVVVVTGSSNDSFFTPPAFVLETLLPALR